ncbi:MAG TPA: polymer-forming cytoskeletal protein [Sphingobacteriaceae bacterium]
MEKASPKQVKTVRKIPSLISEGVVLEGRIKSAAAVQLEGTLVGDIVHSDNVIVGEQGLIEGNINAKSIIVCGTVNGNLTAGSIEIRSTAKISGKLHTQRLMMEQGAVYNGCLSMEQVVED